MVRSSGTLNVQKNHGHQKTSAALYLLATLAVAALVLILDQAVKSAVRGSMRLGESVVAIPGVLDITYIENSGGAFGILAGRSMLLVAGSAVAVGFVLWILFSLGPSKSVTLGCGLVLGGAAGNLADRLLRGEVTDYLDLRFWPLEHWPVFNLADTAIVVGALLLLLASSRRERV
ncbi:signal peptidase II [Rubrobacter calidifluminis]|uniref:signal peptidase II n=1 Tax=Rubrobacter calidifluminis TaxID=1392640 RepID=UPI0023609B52|nr:signal peptidase II [Rubrobacter calidifluminis]